MGAVQGGSKGCLAGGFVALAGLFLVTRLFLCVCVAPKQEAKQVWGGPVPWERGRRAQGPCGPQGRRECPPGHL